MKILSIVVRRLGPAMLRVACLLSLAACAEEGAAAQDEGGDHIMTKVRFDGVLYVDAGTSDFKIAERVRTRTQSALSALRRSKVFVSSMASTELDTPRYDKEAVTVVDPKIDARRQAIRVRFHVVEGAIVPSALRAVESIESGFLHRDDEAVAQDVLSHCTDREAQGRESSRALSFVFDPSSDSCKAAMRDEERRIEESRRALSDAEHEVVVQEFDRVYAPFTAVLGEPRRPESAVAVPGGGSDNSPNRSASSRRSNGGRDEAQASGASKRGGGASRSVAASPALPEVPTDAVPVESAIDHGGFELSSLLVLVEPKFLAIWASLLALIPLLRRQRPTVRPDHAPASRVPASRQRN